MRTTLKPVLALAALTVAWFSADDVMAFHRHHGSWGSSGGSYGSWGSSGGSWGSSGGSYGGSYGGSSGGYHRMHRHRWHSNGGSSGGSWGSSGGGWGSSGGSSGGYSTSYYGGSSGGYSGGSSGGGVIYSEGYNEVPADAVPATPLQPATPTEAAPADGTSAFTGSGLILVQVPADAKVFVNGKATTSTGTERQFVSRGLIRGANYNYEVTAEFVRDGKPVTITKVAKLTAGTNIDLAFDEIADEPNSVVTAKPLTTTLTVHVPADAKVYLAGNETKQTGDVREFSTNKLTAGEGWNDYTVRAEFEQDGKLVTKEQVVSIAAGETKAITFDFGANAGNDPIAETAQK